MTDTDIDPVLDRCAQAQESLMAAAPNSPEWRAAVVERRDAVRSAHAAGRSLATIAAVMDISRQAVHKVVRP